MSDSEPKPVAYDARPETVLPPMVSHDPLQRTKRRRSTIQRARMNRRRRWYVVLGFAVTIALLSALTAILSGLFLFALAGVTMGVVTVTTQYLAEADIALAHTRARACEREMRTAKRELGILSGHFNAAHNAIKRVNPAVADDLLAGVNADLLRAHLTARRLEADAA